MIVIFSLNQVYEGHQYKLSLKFSPSYPFQAPTVSKHRMRRLKLCPVSYLRQVKFESACFHPNVDQYGNICLDILKDKWSATYTVRTILLSIQALLGGLLLSFFFFLALRACLTYFRQNQIVIVRWTLTRRDFGRTKPSTRKYCSVSMRNHFMLQNKTEMYISLQQLVTHAASYIWWTDPPFLSRVMW